MAFRFALAPLLRLRQSLERQHALALEKASFELARARERLAQLDRFLADSARTDAASLAAGRTAAEVQFAGLVGQQLGQFRIQLTEEVGRLEALRQQAAERYQQAYREREVLESLRLRHRRAYELDQMRRQQKELDAAYLLQRWHKQGG